MENPGKVWLVGAGPGDAELLTIKGRRILSQADVVVYDALTGDGVISMFPGDAKQIYVGKRAGSHTKKQEEINEILLAEALKGQKVVRLKGGDPFVFGRGSEEIALLKESKIPFEVVPGVTSAVSVLAYCGIPATHRGIATSFHVITGHNQNGKPVDLDFEAFVRTKGTLIFLMGLSSIKKICQGLIDGGMSPDMPAAVLEKGTTAGQRKVIATVSTLEEESIKAEIEAPAIIVAGEVCKLAETCQWAEDRPLHGKKVLVTRPKALASAMSKKLREAGAEVVEFPAIMTRLVEEHNLLDSVFDHLEVFTWLVLTSPSGVDLLFQYMRKKRKDIRVLFGLRIAVIGSATEKKLADHGLYADYIPDVYEAAALGSGLAEQVGETEKVLILRALKGSDQLTDALKEKGIVYEDIPLYETDYLSDGFLTEHVSHLLQKGSFDYVTFTSGSTVEGFFKAVGPDPLWLCGFKAVCIGKQTEEMAMGKGMNTITAKVASMDSMIECMIRDVCTLPTEEL